MLGRANLDADRAVPHADRRSRDRRPSPPRPSVAVVSYLAQADHSPRGERTRHICEALADRADVKLVAGPAHAGGTHRMRSPLPRRVAGRLIRQVMVDKYEPWSRIHFRAWAPDVDGALLIGWPFSPIGYAARALARRGIPFVADVGDPWALTSSSPSGAAIGRRRAKALERAMWSRAAGAVLTTRGQRDSLQRLFPDLPVLVRPNGYEEVLDVMPEPANFWSSKRGMPLTLAHFGSIYDSRVDAARQLERIAAEGPWNGLVLRQFGADWTSSLVGRRLENVRVEPRDPVSWDAAITEAASVDAVLVIGNRDPGQLPSKAVSYLTLPAPRIAITSNPTSDAVGEYTASRPGWLVLGLDDSDAADRVAGHLGRTWRREDLIPPLEESWSVVSRCIADFVIDALVTQSTRTRAREPR